MKVVVCDYEFPSLDPERAAFEGLTGLELIDGGCRSTEEVMKATADADGVLNQWNRLTREVIENMSRCRVIATYGIGVDKIDVAAATEKGIYVCNVPDYNKHEVADHTVAMLLSASRRLVSLDRLMREGKYGFMYLNEPMYRLEGQTVGLVGFGKIPVKVAYKLSTAFEMNIIAYDPFVSAETMAEHGVRKVDMETLMSESDFVSIHVPLTANTRYMIGDTLLRRMKRTAYLINCGRGAIVEEAALVEVLRERAIAGAAIDVFEEEPLPVEHPLMQLDNVYLTPHCAWHTRESMYDMQWGAAHQVALVLEGREPTNAVNGDAVRALRVAGAEAKK